MVRWRAGCRRENNLWCRASPSGPWRLDLTVSECDAGSWVFRRDPSLRVPWDEAVLRTNAGVPYLAPQLQLLFTSRERRPKDVLDAAEIVPSLSREQAAFLERVLPADHPWLHLNERTDLPSGTVCSARRATLRLRDVAPSPAPT